MERTDHTDYSAFKPFWYSRLLGQTAQAALLYGLLIYLVAETESGIWPALYVIMSIVPALIFGLIGGIVADWLPQRPLMFALNLVRGLCIVPAIRGDLSVAEVFAITGVIWTVHQFYAPAESAMLPRLTSRHDLAKATSRYNLAIPVAQLLGMIILAPLTLKFGNVDILLGCCTALYLSANIALAYVRISDHGAIPHDEPVVAEAAGFLRAGWRQIASDNRAFSALVDSVVLGIGLSALVVIVPQFLEDVLNTGADNTVFVFAPAAAGLVAGLQIAPFAGRLIGHGRLASAGIGLFCTALLAIGSINAIATWLNERSGAIHWLDDRHGLSPEISTTMLFSIPAGFAVGLVNVAIRTELVVRTPAPSHARVFSTQMTIANLGALLPTVAIGLLVDIVPVQLVAVTIAVLLAAGALLGRRIGRASVKSNEGGG